MKFPDFLDFRAPSGGSGLTPEQITIIEGNLGVQVDVPQGYKEIEWSNGVPISIKTYLSSDKARLLYNNTITWTNGVPTQIVVHNVDNNTVKIKTITWNNGIPVSITEENG